MGFPLVGEWKGHTGAVSGLAFMPDGKGLVTSSWDRMVKYWDVASLGDVQWPSGRTMKATIIRQFEGWHTVRYSISVSPQSTNAIDSLTGSYPFHSCLT